MQSTVRFMFEQDMGSITDCSVLVALDSWLVSHGSERVP